MKRCLFIISLFLGLSALSDPIGITVNGTDIGQRSGEGWTFAERVLRLTGDGPFVLSGKNEDGEVHVSHESNSTVVLSDFELQTWRAGRPAYSVGLKETSDDSPEAIHAEIRLVGTNSLINTSNVGNDLYRQGGITVYHGSTVRIDKAEGLENRDACLLAVGGSGSAGIGGSRSRSTGRITISGGTICAKGGLNAAGIGGGNYLGTDGEVPGGVLIEGGVVEASSLFGASGIGAGREVTMGKGYDIRITGGTVLASECGVAAATSVAFPVRITGGSVSGAVVNPQNDAGNVLRRVTVPEVGVGSIAITGLPNGYGTKDITSVDGNVYLYLPDGDYAFTAGGEKYMVRVDGADTVAWRPLGVTVNGVDVLMCDGYDPETQTLTITDKREYLLSGTNTEGKVRIVLDGYFSVTCENLKLTSSDSPIVVRSGKAASIILKGTNELTATGERRAAISVEADANLRISADEDSASLTAVGGAWAAGIGSSREEAMGMLVIAGGSVSAQGGIFAPGIGTGYASANASASAGKIRVEGGIVTGRGGSYAPGIGCGYDGQGCDIEITGGRILSERGKNVNVDLGAQNEAVTVAISGGTVYAYAMGRVNGEKSGFETRVTGGNVQSLFHYPELTDGEGRVYEVKIPVSSAEGTPVKITGLGTYGVKDIVALNGFVCLYLPDGKYRFAVNDKRYTALIVDGKVTLFENWLTGVLVDGTDVSSGSGKGWTYDSESKILLFSESKSYVLSGSNAEGEVLPQVDFGKDVTIVVDGLCDLGTNLSLRRNASLAIDSAKANELCELRVAAVNGSDKFPVKIRGGLVKIRKIEDAGVSLKGGTLVTETISSEDGVKSTIIGGNLIVNEISPAPTDIDERSVYRVVVNGNWADGTRMSVGNLSGYGTKDIFAVDGGICLWLANGDYEFTVNGQPYVAFVRDGDTVAHIPGNVRLERKDGSIDEFMLFSTALSAAGDGDTLTLLTDIAETLVAPIAGRTLTLKGNGRKLTLGLDGGSALFARDAKITAFDVNFKGSGSVAALADLTEGGSFTLENCVIENFKTSKADLISAFGAKLVVTDTRLAANDVGSAYLFNVSSSEGTPETLPACVMNGLVATDNVCKAVIRSYNGTDNVRAHRFVSGSLPANALHCVCGVSEVSPDYVGEGKTVILEHGAELSLAYGTPTKIVLDVQSAITRVGDKLIGNYVNQMTSAANVRIKASGYTAVERDGEIYLGSVTNFLYAVESDPTYDVFSSFEEALDASSTVSLVRYRNIPDGREVFEQSDDLVVPSNSLITLRTVLRETKDGVSTTWDGSTTNVVALTGSVTACGVLTLENVDVKGTLILAGGKIIVGREFALDEASVLVDLAESITPGTAPVIVSDKFMPLELLTHFRLKRDDLLFEMTNGGLRIVEAKYEAARIGETFYETFAEAMNVVPPNGTVSAVSVTNVVSCEYLDLVKFGDRVELAPAKGRIVIGSVLAEVAGQLLVVDEQPSIPTRLWSEGSTLTIGANSSVAFGNVRILGALTLAGDGVLDLSGYVGELTVRPTRPGVIACGMSERVNLKLAPGVDGILVKNGEFVSWRGGSFSAIFTQTGNGAGTVRINDYGRIVMRSFSDVTDGVLSYQYRDESGETGTITNLTFGVLYCKVENNRRIVVMPPASLYPDAASRPKFKNKSGEYVDFTIEDGKGCMEDDLPFTGKHANYQREVKVFVRNYDAVDVDICSFFVLASKEDAKQAVEDAYRNDEDVRKVLDRILEICDNVLDIADLSSFLVAVIFEKFAYYEIMDVVQVIKCFAEVIARAACVCYVGHGEENKDYYCLAHLKVAYEKAIEEKETVHTYWNIKAPAYTLPAGSGLDIDCAGMPEIEMGPIVSAIVGHFTEEHVEKLENIVFEKVIDFIVDTIGHAGREGLLKKVSRVLRGESKEPMFTIPRGAKMEVVKIDEGYATKDHSCAGTLFDVSGELTLKDCTFESLEPTPNGFIRIRSGGIVKFDNVKLNRAGAKNCVVEEGGLIVPWSSTVTNTVSRIGISGQTGNGDVFSHAVYGLTSQAAYAKMFFNDAKPANCSLVLDAKTGNIYWSVYDPPKPVPVQPKFMPDHPFEIYTYAYEGMTYVAVFGQPANGVNGCVYYVQTATDVRGPWTRCSQHVWKATSDGPVAGMDGVLELIPYADKSRFFRIVADVE